MSLNVRLLNKVKKHILEEPLRLRMSSWLRIATKASQKQQRFGPRGEFTDYGEPNTQTFPACKTIGCIAGWTVLLGLPADQAKNISPDDDIEEIAVRLLNMDYSDMCSLFYVGDWPDHLHQAYIAAKTPIERAKLVAAAIDDFKKTYKLGGVSNA